LEIAKLIQSALGVAFIVFLVWKLFPKPKPLTIERVRENFIRCYPEQSIHHIYVDTSENTAFVMLSDASIFGVARTLGDRVVCRSFNLEELRSVINHDSEIIMYFKDFTLPKLKLTLSEDEAREVEEALLLDGGEVTSHAS